MSENTDSQKKLSRQIRVMIAEEVRIRCLGPRKTKWAKELGQASWVSQGPELSGTGVQGV